jgi:hypothetical protein
MMQSYASAAWLRDDGPILPHGMQAKDTSGNPSPRIAWARAAGPIRSFGGVASA